MAILDVQHIEKHFGDIPVLKDISFSLEEGQALSIIGSSGSGKTTLLRCLNFLETPDHGVISVRGETLFDAADPASLRVAGSAARSSRIFAPMWRVTRRKLSISSSGALNTLVFTRWMM